jgi:hypothetical protein
VFKVRPYKFDEKNLAPAQAILSCSSGFGGNKAMLLQGYLVMTFF